jgi:hypothetical protein
MDNLTPEQKSAVAIRHVLGLIKRHPEVGFYLGLGTQSFALLTEADAANYGVDLEHVRRHYRSESPKNPYEGQDVPSTPAAMERELIANQGKGDWQSWHPDRITCIDELFHHLRKLVRAIRYNDADQVTEHAADLANIAAKTAAEHGNLEA